MMVVVFVQRPGDKRDIASALFLVVVVVVSRARGFPDNVGPVLNCTRKSYGKESTKVYFSSSFRREKIMPLTDARV